MNNRLNFLFAIVVFAAVFSCKKETNSFFSNGTAVTLTSNTNTFTASSSDSLSTVLILSWTSPNYATDSSTTKYIVQIDSASNFSNPVIYTVSGKDSVSFTAKDFNNMLLKLGLSFNVKYTVNVRVVSSYANNNDQKISNVLTMQATPYVTPAIVLPPQNGTLYLVGSAAAGGWGNPVPLPAQQFTKIDSLDYEGTFYLNGGQQYLMLPVDGDWSHKYAVADNTVVGLSAGGDFGYDLSSNFPGPAASGTYKISTDFQHGTFTVTPVTLYGELYVPGDYQGWTPATAPTLASPSSDGNYEGYINVPAGGTYQFKLTAEPDWNGTTYGDGGGGTLSTSGGNLTFPGAGYYKVNASTANNTWSVTATTWSIIGSFAASGWSNDIDMTYSSGDNDWTGTVTLAAGDQFKFRANHDWGLNYGDKGADGSLEQNGDNLAGYDAGTYTVTLYLNNAGYYTYKLVKQ